MWCCSVECVFMFVDVDVYFCFILLMLIVLVDVGMNVSLCCLLVLLVCCWCVVVVLMLCVYFVVGMFWCVFWKVDELYFFGIVINIIECGDWVVFNVVFELFVEKFLLMYWMGVLVVLVLFDMLLYEVVCVVVLFWMVLMCWVVWCMVCLLCSEVCDWCLCVGVDFVCGWLGLILVVCCEVGLDVGGVVLCDYVLGVLLLFVGCVGLVEYVYKFIVDVL